MNGWVSCYKKDEYSNNWNDCFDKTVEMLWERAKQHLLNGNSVIFDMGFWHKKDRLFAKTVAQDCGANFVLLFECS